MSTIPYLEAGFDVFLLTSVIEFLLELFLLVGIIPEVTLLMLFALERTGPFGLS